MSEIVDVTGVDEAGSSWDAAIPVAIDPSGGTARVITAANPEWDEVRLAWNRAVDQRPAMVSFPENQQQVQATIRAAREAGLRVAPQGTGHHASSLGDLAGSVLLRTDRLREVTVDPTSQRIRVGSGVTWGEATAALAPHGLVGLAGSAADVGVTGYVLGGGCSWFARKYGLACSSVAAAELVTGDGVFHRVDADHEPDLWWSLRGGMGAGMVVTALELQVFPAATVFAGMLLYPLERAAEILPAYRAWTENLTEDATTSLRLLRLPPLPDMPEVIRGKAFVGIDGAIDLPEAVAAAVLQPLRDLGPIVDTFATIPGAALQDIHMDPPGPAGGVTDGVILTDLPDDAIDALMQVAGPRVDSPLLAVELRHLGGAVGRPAPGGGVIDQLPGKYLLCGIAVAGSPEAISAAAARIDELEEAMAPWTAELAFPNFAEREPRAAGPRFYPTEVAARLSQIRSEHDPDGVIHTIYCS